MCNHHSCTFAHIIAGLFAIVLSVAPCAVRAETIRLVDGTSVIGRVLSVDEDQVLLRHGLVERKIAKSRIAQPAAGALKDAQTALDRKDYLGACDLSRQILIWEPENAEAAGLWRRAHERYMRSILEGPSPHPFMGEGLTPLFELLTADDLPIVHEVLTGPAGLDHWPYTILLAWMKSEASVEPLAQVLKKWLPGFARMYAMYALGEIGSEKATPTLASALLRDPDPIVRRRAGEGLNKLTPPLTVVMRKAAQSDRDGGVQEEMSWLLENPGYQRTDMPLLRPGQASAGYLDGTAYMVYVPTGYDPRVRTHMLIFVHGTEGSAAGSIALCRADAESHGIILLAPQFDMGTYPNYGQFNIGIRNLRPDLKLIKIVDQLARYLNFRKDRLLMSGHSQGGHFTHRFVAAHPERVWRAAPWGTNCPVMPDPGLVFPVGMGRTDWAPDLVELSVEKYLQVPVAFVCGTKDELYRQDNAKNFMAAATAYADKHQFRCKAAYIPVPDAGHGDPAGWAAARDFLFAELPKK